MRYLIAVVYKVRTVVRYCAYRSLLLLPGCQVKMLWLRLLATLSLAVACARAHGRVLQPPGRASAWRSGFPSDPNYDDDGLNCGGFYHQWEVNGGKCGICGDAYDLAEPRSHELGGRYGQGFIVEHYEAGSVFEATIELSAYHRGYWEFRICPDPLDNDQECFDNYLVELENGDTKYYPIGSAKYNLNYRLPAGLECEHCVLQWKYTAGNNWGVCANGTQGLGCGNQEEFRACSDISIGAF
ncbi:hypothetical protein EVAR_78324_1 [Eumeta japonica]|uniref:Chitin-binding type-4 domain-containing protein n=1 Tax=Eumeta variegata TaxID=151549 RepID=A0A4C1T380_EUMVA|nr:hypothetical protein EVAR_78324_1 [Eumeta japonica]